MNQRRWKRDELGELQGKGNGCRATVYTEPYDDNELPTVVAVVYKGDSMIARKIHNTEASAKSWADTFIKPFVR